MGRGLIDIAKLLLQFKAPIENKNFEGATPLIIAVQENQIEATKLLLEW